MKCYAYNPNAFTNANGTDWDRWRSLYKFVNYAVAFMDRTGTIATPVNSVISDKMAMPAYDPNFSSSYYECCVQRASEIMQTQERLDVPIRLMYSGGIDSSLILSSFIESVGLDEASNRIELLMNQESIYENPWMWEKIIRPNFKILDSDQHASYYTKKNIIVAGEGNDQLFGTDMYRDIVNWGGDGILNLPCTEGRIKDYFSYKNLTEDESDLWFNLLKQQMETTKAPIDTFGDYWWWVNFSCKWSNVFYRMLFYTPTPEIVNQEYLDTYYQQFFNTKEFQLWSLKDREHKHQGNYTTYKFHARDLVADFIGAPEYRKKLKKPSLTHVVRLRHSCDLIDHEYKFHYAINPMDWYQPNNSFNF